jgi:hypothetical protein
VSWSYPKRSRDASDRKWRATPQVKSLTRTIGRGFENASGLGFWTSHPLHHANMVNRQSHVRPEPFEARARRARAKNRMRKAGNHEPTASQMVFMGTRFSIGLQM